MTRGEATEKAVRFWLERAQESLTSATDEARARRLAFAVNRCYYAAFYAASAVLLERGHRFVKHSGLRAAIHRELVKPGFLADDWGKFYDRLFHDRQQGDYVEFVAFEPGEVEETVRRTIDLVRAFEDLRQSRP